MERLSDVMDAAYPGHTPKDNLCRKVFGLWAQIIPERTLHHARPVDIHDGVLWVHTSSAAWASELHFWREPLLVALKEKIPSLTIRDIRFRQGPLPELRVPVRLQKHAPSPVNPQEVPEELARIATRIQDEDLRQAILAAAAACPADETDK